MMSEPESWIGRSLSGGRYRIKAKLGEGGMALVYLAHDRNLDCDVVVKVPRSAMLEEPEFAARFTREIRSLVQLVHPNIVRVIDVGEEGGVPFSVMQYLSGGTLRDRRRLDPADKPVADRVKDVTSWLEPVAAALDFIHKQGYVHRDVKPENILFDRHGHAYLSDFGIAKIVAERSQEQQRQTACLTGTGMIVGTVAYMAPEVLLGQPYDGRADQYALAVTVFELLAETFPFNAPTPAALLLQQTTKPPLRLESRVPSLPPGIAAAVHRGLDADCRRRHADCRALAGDVIAAATSASWRPAEKPAPTRTPPIPMPKEERIEVRCPGCQKRLKARQSVVGKKVRCARCEMTFRIAAYSASSVPVKVQATVATAEHEPGGFDIPPAETFDEFTPAQLPEDPVPRRHPVLLTVLVASCLAIALVGVVVAAKFVGHSKEGPLGERPQLALKATPGENDQPGSSTSNPPLPTPPSADGQGGGGGVDRVWPALPKEVQDWNKKRPDPGSGRAEPPPRRSTPPIRRRPGPIPGDTFKPLPVEPPPQEPPPETPPAPSMPPPKLGPDNSGRPQPESDEAIRKAVTEFFMKLYKDNARAFEILKIEKPVLRKVRDNHWEWTSVSYVRFRAFGHGTDTAIFAIKDGKVIQAVWSKNQVDMFGKPSEVR